jgi:hypothetical protein
MPLSEFVDREAAREAVRAIARNLEEASIGLSRLLDLLLEDLGGVDDEERRRSIFEERNE